MYKSAKEEREEQSKEKVHDRYKLIFHLRGGGGGGVVGGGAIHVYFKQSKYILSVSAHTGK